jgi:hypothetical protein
MNRELTQDEARDQRTLFKILQRNRLNEWLGGTDFYVQLIRNLDAMQITGTTDGEELAALTDEDAKDRPWVMGKSHNENSWQGPYRLLVGPPTATNWVVLTSYRTILHFRQCRRATENELKQAGITQ